MKLFRVWFLVGLMLGAGEVRPVHALSVAILHSFTNTPDGNSPFVFDGLLQGSDGNFYGTAFLGGSNGVGMIFRIGPGGAYTNLHSFAGYPVDGAFPYSGLAQGSDGNFYGTAYQGGNNGFGTVYRITPSGSYSNLYSFAGAPDGRNPFGTVVQGSDGNFYGTTQYGGTSTNCNNGCGTVYRISPTGSYSNLHSFIGSPSDGQWPYVKLVQGNDGNFYGTTSAGGASGNGTVFRITPAGVETAPYSFTGGADGSFPEAGLVLGNDGLFYGTTAGGGTSTNCGFFGCGTVYSIKPGVQFNFLHSFAGLPAGDGNGPQGGLVLGSDGNFYGITVGGGTSTNCGGGCGTIFRISPTGSYSNLYSFIGAPTDGQSPYARLVQNTNGDFYGVTGVGGTNNNGTVYKFTIPLNPPANQISGIQVSGTSVVLSLPSVAGETYQLQFSPAMVPTNWSNISGAFVSNSIGALLTLTNAGGASGPQGFYRFAITP